MPKSCIPGYDDALREERRIREEIFLGVNPRICGIEIQNITPFLLARLSQMETPFLCGGPVNKSDIIYFLWALSPAFVGEKRKYPRSNFFRKLTFRNPLGPYAQRDAFIADVSKHLSKQWKEAEASIDEFVRDTFMDANNGGSIESVPYVTGVAWMLYKMSCEPFKWHTDRVMHTPVRFIYQLTRCHRLENGAILYNEKSDGVKARWLDVLNGKN